MTTTTREELLTLLRANLTPDPLVHWPYCPHCGHGDPLGHKDGCSWWRANEIAFDASIGELEFEDDDDAKEPTRPGQRVRCVMPKEGVFNLGDEFVVAWLCGGDVQFEGRDDWWPKWWFEVIPGPPPEGQTEADEDEDCDLATAHAELDEMLEVWDSEIPWHRNYREGRALIRGVSLTTYYEIGRCLRVRDAHPTWAYNDDGVWRPLDSGVCYIDELPRKGGV